MTLPTGYYQSGDAMTLFVNQGERDACVLGTIDDHMIVEYEMPSGTTAMQILKNEKSAGDGYCRAFSHVRSVSYTSCPKIWIQAISDGVGVWKGNSQYGGYIDFPKEGVQS